MRDRRAAPSVLLVDDAAGPGEETPAVDRRRRPRRWVALVAVVALVVPAAVLVATRGGRDDRPGPGGPVAEVVSPEAFAEREARFEDSLLSLSEDDWWDIGARQGLVLLDRAAETGDRSRVDEANRLLVEGSDRIDDGDDDAAAFHGGAFTFLRALLLFGDRPELLRPRSAEHLREALEPYRQAVYADAGPGPWRPVAERLTENHRLQLIVTGMLLTEVDAGSSYRGRPVKDDDPDTDDLWSWFRDAYLRYNADWGDGRTDHFRADPAAAEKDSLGYFAVHLGDHWLVRDLHSDPVIRAHAEILVDRLLADWAEDAVLGLYTGYSGRHYHRGHAAGRPTWALSYLLFDGLGYEPDVTGPHAVAAGTGWGGWAHLAVVTGDYTPDAEDFPHVLVHLARDKGDGYLVTEGADPRANWVERDFALGFLAAGQGSYDRHAGGFYVSGDLPGGGLNVVPFYGAEPLPAAQGKPTYSSSTVLARRVAITRNWDARERRPGRDGRRNTRDDRVVPLERGRLWVSAERWGDEPRAFDDLMRVGPWLFLRERSEASGREVYLAVRPVEGGLRRLDDAQEGAVFELTAPGTATVWEVATSDDVRSFAAFQRDVRDNPLRVAPGRITYESSLAGATLGYDRAGDQAHEVDGRPVDWSAFDHGFSTPWSTNPFGSATASLARSGYGVSYDWDPDRDGDYDEPPEKVVDNDPDGPPARDG